MTAKEILKAKFKAHPYSFWAKKLDSEIHIPKEDSYGTLCGKHGALLGNNYAPHFPEHPMCQRCIEEAIRLEHKLLMQ